MFSAVALKPHRGLKVAVALLALAVLVLGALVAAAPTLGRKLILRGLQQGDPRAVLPADGDYELVHLTLGDGTAVVGQFGRARGPDSGARAATVIFFYGISQTLASPADQKVFHALRDLGCNVFIPEFPGYGMSGGQPSEAGFYETAEAALAHLRSRPDVDPRRIIAAGRSLGAATAVDLASRQKLAGLIGVGTFTSAADTLDHSLWWLPRRLAESATAECRFDNLAKIKAVHCPVLLIYGGRDTVVPPEMAASLAAAASGPITLRSVDHSRHNDLWKSRAYGLDQAVGAWIKALPR